MFSYRLHTAFSVHLLGFVPALSLETSARSIPPENRCFHPIVTAPLPIPFSNHQLLYPPLYSPSHPPVQNRVDPACLHGEQSANQTQHANINIHFIAALTSN